VLFLCALVGFLKLAAPNSIPAWKTLRDAGPVNDHTVLEKQLMEAIRDGDSIQVQNLLEQGADPNARDGDGNTCLHYASAWGNLKAIRVLVSAGADVGVRNWSGWGAEGYSVTVQAEVYFRNLVAEWEKRRVEEKRAKEMQGVDGVGNGGSVRPQQKRMPGSIRLVTQEESSGIPDEKSTRDDAPGPGLLGAFASPVGQPDMWK